MSTINEVKECRKCLTTKPASDFWENPRNKDGLVSYCKECNSKRTREWHKSHKEAQGRYNKKCLLARSKEEKGQEPGYIVPGDLTEGFCLFCGNRFPYEKRRRARLYCSVKCRSSAVRQRAKKS